MYSDLLEVIRTKKEADALLTEIDVLRESVHRSGGKSFAETLKNKIRPETAVELAKHEKELDQVRKWVENLKILKLTVAFEPTGETAERIVLWARKEVDPQVIVETVTEPAVVAGAVVEYAGKYGDFSAGPRMEKAINGLKLI